MVSAACAFDGTSTVYLSVSQTENQVIPGSPSGLQSSNTHRMKGPLSGHFRNSVDVGEYVQTLLSYTVYSDPIHIEGFRMCYRVLWTDIMLSIVLS
jgi:hypothetical protein